MGLVEISDTEIKGLIILAGRAQLDSYCKKIITKGGILQGGILKRMFFMSVPRRTLAKL